MLHMQMGHKPQNKRLSQWKWLEPIAGREGEKPLDGRAISGPGPGGPSRIHQGGDVLVQP